MANELVVNDQGCYESMINAGLRLASIPEAEGGWLEYFSETEMGDLRIQDDILRAQTAIMLENNKRWQMQLCKGRVDPSTGRRIIDEGTRSALIGGFSDYLFPIIRAAFPTNPINDLVSVQPTNRRTATVVYWNWVVGANKGGYIKGQKLFDANTGKQDSGFHFSDNVVENEAQTALGSANATFGGTLTFNDGGGVLPATVQIAASLTTAGTLTFYDNGSGGFTNGAGVTISSSSINYSTGAYSITVSGDTFTTVAPVATYAYESEGSSMLPQVDVQIVTSTTETQRRALQLNYSLEAMQDVLAEFGVSLEPNLISGAAEQMNFEIARQIIHRLWIVAPVSGTFPTTGSTTYTQQEHFRDLIYYLTSASNSIWQRTQKGYGNWLVIDELAANIIESLPAGMFQPLPTPANVMGIHKIGTLMGKFAVYKDIHLSAEPGASSYGNILMGFKGTEFFQAGFVYSPYQLMYTTESLTTSNFLTQKGLASRYALKMINQDFYVRINIGA